ncbi:SgcJ/EcaC family oxidoreductase [Parapedobacter pyrenivorans]|uniref:SgcJ/EcaC family oxidoreductase n=1 Tax=Parapedobacter pyrenivorans TaxID=1305674 RepID=UPI003340E418
MKKFINFKAGFFLLLSINALAVLARVIYVTPPISINSEPLPQDRAADVQAILKLEQTVADGWAAGDGGLMASAYTEQVDYVTFLGDRLQSKAAIASVHQALFANVLKGSSLADREVRSIRFLADSVALIHLTGAVKTAGRKEPKKNRASIQTMVAVRHDGEWKFTAFHNTRIRRLSLLEAIGM